METGDHNKTVFKLLNVEKEEKSQKLSNLQVGCGLNSGFPL